MYFKFLSTSYTVFTELGGALYFKLKYMEAHNLKDPNHQTGNLKADALTSADAPIDFSGYNYTKISEETHPLLCETDLINNFEIYTDWFVETMNTQLRFKYLIPALSHKAAGVLLSGRLSKYSLKLSSSMLGSFLYSKPPALSELIMVNDALTNNSSAVGKFGGGNAEVSGDVDDLCLLSATGYSDSITYSNFIYSNLGERGFKVYDNLSADYCVHPMNVDYLDLPHLPVLDY